VEIKQLQRSEFFHDMMHNMNGNGALREAFQSGRSGIPVRTSMMNPQRKRMWTTTQ
jgi:hypothetical protein